VQVAAFHFKRHVLLIDSQEKIPSLMRCQIIRSDREHEFLLVSAQKNTPAAAQCDAKELLDSPLPWLERKGNILDGVPSPSGRSGIA
jgi:hypothetical protein